MPCRIYLRREKQAIHERDTYSCKDVTIFAPVWVQEALKILGKHLIGTAFDVYDNSTSRFTTQPRNNSDPVESFTITENFNDQSLTVLQRIARNEASNTSGVINTTLYCDIKDNSVVYSIRDLVRQSVICGSDEAIACGGYGCAPECQVKQRVYVCDLAALQFQQPYNTGRFVIVQQEGSYKGILDDFIYENVVGEKKRLFNDVKTAWDAKDRETVDRYLPHDGFGLPGRKSCFIDIKAYKKFVALDVVLSGTALSEVASRHGDQINFKFLKYGTGFFAWKFATELDRLILSGVVDGLEQLFEKGDAKVLNAIKRVELPFYKTDPKSLSRLESFRKRFGIKVKFGANDALKQTSKKKVIATTNCGDNHAAFGNEMGYRSVDAAISENLASKGNIFCPNINLLMTEKFVEI